MSCFLEMKWCQGQNIWNVSHWTAASTESEWARSCTECSTVYYDEMFFMKMGEFLNIYLMGICAQ